MKKIIIILIFTAFLNLNASQIQVHAHHDENGLIDSYNVYTWNGPDKEMIITKYTLVEAQSKFGKILDKSEAGTSKSPDRIILHYNDSTGELENATFQAISVKINDKTTGEFENNKKDQDSISDEIKTDAEIAKDDVEIKTGKKLDGDPK